MNRTRLVLAALAMLVLALNSYAAKYGFMGYDETTQQMTAYVFDDQGNMFHANVYIDQSNPGGGIGGYDGYADEVEEYYCDVPLTPWEPGRAIHVPSGEINVITATVDFLDEFYQPTGEQLVIRDTLESNLDEENETGWYTYRQDSCTAVLPDTIRINSSFCATICHGTFTVPIYCEDPGYNPDLVQVTVTNGCDPLETHCDNPDCPRIDTSLFTYRIRVFPGCRIYLVLTYCGEGPGCICIWRSDFVLPAEMSGFDAVSGDNQVTLNWGTLSETNLEHFRLSRADSPEGVFTEIVDARTAATNTAVSHNYSYVDRSAMNGRTYYYKLDIVDANGAHTYNDGNGAVIVSASPQSGIANTYALAQNFPNPFNSQTSFTFSIANSERVSLKVFDLLGREVATVVNKTMDAGVHSVNWSAEGLASGIYMYELNAGAFSETKKLVFMK